MTPLWIAATARTCSQVVCDMLNQTGMFAPIIWEWYNSTQFDEMPKSPPKYCKLFPEQFNAHFGHWDFGVIEDAIPGLRWVYLTRRDKIAQTASFLLAKKSGVWLYRENAVSLKAKYESFVEQIADDDLLRTYKWLNAMDEKLAQFFESRPHLLLVAEDIKKSPVDAAIAILEYLGVSKWSKLTPRLCVMKHPMRAKLESRLRSLIDG